MKIKSYVQGRWMASTDAGIAVRDATTGAVVAEVSSAGIDFAQVLDYARSRGGPALRALTFHERAARLKALGKRLLELKDEFYELSYRTGAAQLRGGELQQELPMPDLSGTWQGDRRRWDRPSYRIGRKVRWFRRIPRPACRAVRCRHR